MGSVTGAGNGSDSGSDHRRDRCLCLLRGVGRGGFDADVVGQAHGHPLGRRDHRHCAPRLDQQAGDERDMEHDGHAEPELFLAAKVGKFGHGQRAMGPPMNRW